MNIKNIDNNAKEKIAELMPQALAAAIESYQNFLLKPVPSGNKEFKEYHAGLKCCVAHIEHIFKLMAVSASVGKINMIEANNDIESLIATAQKEISEIL